MKGKTNKFGQSKLKASDRIKLERKSDLRDERNVKDDLPKIVFSFKDIDTIQVPPGQTYNEWQSKELLAYMLTKFGYLCQNNIIEAQQKRMLKIYGDFPSKTKFKKPQHIVENVKWSVIMDIKGQKGRVVGHIIDNVFYVVFLDIDHLFYISEKKNT